jgi:uncharacterized membrane protein/DNA-directed RNA polymerase subunit M/transcription elongation factor TFIIS
MTIEFHCPNCDKLLRTKDDKAGSWANCPGCGDPITVLASVSAADDEFGFHEPQDDYSNDQDWSDEASTPSQSLADMKTCPMCGEQVKAAAIKCRYCAESLEPIPDGKRQTVHRPSRQGSLVATRIDVGDVIRTSWEIFKAEMGMCIGGFVVAMLCHGAVILVAAIAGFVLFGVMGVAGGLQNAVIGPIFVIFVFFSLAMFYILAQTYFQDGQRVFFLKIARGEEASMGDLFSGGSFVWPSLALGFLYGAIIFLGTMLCLVPGIIAIFMFWPAQMLLIDRDLSIMESLSQAKEITEGNKFSLFVLFLVAIGISVLSNMVVAIGGIIAIPMVTLMMHVTYIKMSGQATALDRA